MIRWLEDDRISSPTVKANFARFKATSFAKGLDEEEVAWRFMSWPRTEDTPARFLLESTDRRRATFTIDAGGIEYGKLEQAEAGLSSTGHGR